MNRRKQLIEDLLKLDLNDVFSTSLVCKKVLWKLNCEDLEHLMKDYFKIKDIVHKVRRALQHVVDNKMRVTRHGRLV